MTTTPAPTSQPALDRFFDTLRRSTVTRSQDRVIAGVCAGLAQRLGVSTAIVRVGAVLVALMGPGVFLYLAAWLLLPRYDGQIRLERAVRSGDGASIALLVITLLGIVPSVVGRFHMGPWPFIAVAVLAVVGLKKGWFGGHGRRHEAWHASTAPGATTTPQPPTAEGPQDAPRA